jgi:hypothetical protein
MIIYIVFVDIIHQISLCIFHSFVVNIITVIGNPNYKKTSEIATSKGFLDAYIFLKIFLNVITNQSKYTGSLGLYKCLKAISICDCVFRAIDKGGNLFSEKNSTALVSRPFIGCPPMISH